jgi:hypothetical protein
MDGVEESKKSVATPTEEPSLGNSEKNSGLEKEAVILVESGKTKGSEPEIGGKEGGGYASYAVSESSSVHKADFPYGMLIDGV